ncbi:MULTISPECIES: response regulator transcription factor [unclassified Candidatus Paralachnospira]|uniref:response regulator transcription factor n=1 Tax=unclassified Candidatus Paralachnospira TaxID=3099471 RepID=UPI003069E13A
MKVLFVEDDPSIAMGLEYSLTQEGYDICVCRQVSEALEALDRETFDLCLLDVTLPDGTGYEICRKAKKREETAVIFLTACDDEGNVVMGLDMGADDYITKPFRIRELLSRMKSVLRRYKKTENGVQNLQFGPITISPLQAKVYKNGEELMLTAMEYRLLLTLAQAEGKVLTRNQLLESLWDVGGDYVNDNTLTVYIKRLREKLGEEELIHTVRGMGYRLGA